jgi:hypothetical protein
MVMTEPHDSRTVTILVDANVCPFCGTSSMQGGQDYHTGEYFYSCGAGCGDPRDGAFPDDFECDESRSLCLARWAVEVRVIKDLAPPYRQWAIEALLDLESEDASHD